MPPVVTGAGRGIGQAIARRLAAEGAAVMINDIQDEKGLATAAELVDAGGKAAYLNADVTKSDEVSALVDATLETFDGIDILVNNVGLTRDGLLMKMGEDDWDPDIRADGFYVVGGLGIGITAKQ